MAVRPLHLGWFMNFTPGEWDHPLAAGGSPWDGKFYVDMAQALERACFDYIMIEDTLMVSETYGGSAEAALKHALQVPKHDPSPLAALISAGDDATGRGRDVVHPGLSAVHAGAALLDAGSHRRRAVRLEHRHLGRGHRRRRTSAWTSCRRANSATRWPTNMSIWSASCSTRGTPDAVVMDRATGTYADYRKVRPIHFEGKFFKVRGPLNTVRSPQGKPVFVQAGGSPRGRAFAARHADSIIAIGQRHRRHEAVPRRRAPPRGVVRAQSGRHQGAVPGLSDPGRDRRRGAVPSAQRMVSSPRFIERALASIATVTDIDFSKYDLDQPLPRLTTNGEQGSLDKFAQWGSGKTLRQLAMERFGARRVGGGFHRLARYGGRAHGQGRWRRSAATAS